MQDFCHGHWSILLIVFFAAIEKKLVLFFSCDKQKYS